MTPLKSNKVTNKNLPINHIPAAGMKTDVRIRAVTLQLLMQSYKSEVRNRNKRNQNILSYTVKLKVKINGWSMVYKGR